MIIGAGKTCSLLGKHDITHVIDCCARWEAVLAFWLLLRMLQFCQLRVTVYGLSKFRSDSRFGRGKV
jgi:hypothetical protein